MTWRSIPLAAFLTLAMAAPAVAQAPAGDSVTGSGTARFITPDLAGLTVPFAIDVRGGPSGEAPTGSLQLLVPFDDPTCLAIRSGGGQVADEAAINFRNTFTGARVVVRIGGGTSGPRSIGAYAATSTTDCGFREPGSIAEVIDGSITIFDAPARPITKEQCKQGGWRSFPGFKNQGDCIRSVTPR
jgi:hypothetical protein